MNPAARLSVALIVGLVLWLPSLSASLDGSIELATAAVRFLVAFVFARVAVGCVSWLFQAYSAGGGQAATDEQRDAEVGRRADDVANAAGLS
jgi:hypothetical protein